MATVVKIQLFSLVMMSILLTAFVGTGSSQLLREISRRRAWDILNRYPDLLNTLYMRYPFLINQQFNSIPYNQYGGNGQQQQYQQQYQHPIQQQNPSFPRP